MRVVQLLALAVLVGFIILAGAIGTIWMMPAHAASCTLMVASWYGSESGNRTANGERFDGTSMTAAHKTLPFGTILDVTYRGNTVRVRINDRGPYVVGRQLDLSKSAADRIGLTILGVGRVCVFIRTGN